MSGLPPVIVERVVDRTVVERAIAGDRRALDHVWRAHRGWIAAVVLAHLPSEIDLEDALQEIAVAVLRSIPRLRDPAALQPWLRQVAVNVVQSSGRRVTVRRRHASGRSSGEAAGPMRRDDPDHALLRQTIDLIQALPEKYREPLLLTSRGLTAPQIAEVLGRPVKTVETQILRGRRLVRECVRDRMSDANAKRSVADE